MYDLNVEIQNAYSDSPPSLVSTPCVTFSVTISSGSAGYLVFIDGGASSQTFPSSTTPFFTYSIADPTAPTVLLVYNVTVQYGMR